MIESGTNKKRLFYMIVLILTFIAMIIGATLAYFYLVESQEEDSTVLYTGKLAINYLDGIYIKDPDLMPISNPTYETKDRVYRNNFSVASSGTLDQTISVSLIVSTNEFASGKLKYIIFNSKGEKMSSGDVPATGETVSLASNMYLASNGIASYTLLIWLDNKSYNQNDDMGKKITGKINILSNQLKN